MTDTFTHAGYTFTEKDLSQLRGSMERTQALSGVQVSFTMGKARQFGGMSMGVHDEALSYREDVVHIQSLPTDEGGIEFAVLAAADKQLLRADSTFPTLLEAIVTGEVFLRRFIEGLKDKRARERLGIKEPGFVDNSFDSNVIGQAEVHYVQSFATELGKIAGLTGFAKFVEARGEVLSVALGVMNKDMPIMLGTIVVVTDKTGSSCTVRDFQNRPMPGLDTYRTVYSALTTTRSSFEKLAQITAKHTRPSFMRRLFGG